MPAQSNEKLIEELTTAYKTEVKGYYYYNAAADLVEDKKGKNVLRHLAKDELDHIKAIYAIAETLKKGGGWLGYREAIEAGADGPAKAAEIFPGENELVDRLRSDQSDINALKIGVDIEESAIDFYTRLLGEATSPEEKVILTELLEMEKGHLKILRWETEALTETGFWGDTMEFSVEMEKD
ncbi:MAG: ferritin family protein [Thermodesulfobacteriota bacterium]